MAKAKFTIKKPKILTLTPKWSGWHGTSGGLISQDGAYHCCLAEAMLQAGFPQKMLTGTGVTFPRNVQGFAQMGKGWQLRDVTMHTDIFAWVNDFDTVLALKLTELGVKITGLKQIDVNIECTTAEQKIEIMRRCIHLLGYDRLKAVPPEGYECVKDFDYSCSTP